MNEYAVADIDPDSPMGVDGNGHPYCVYVIADSSGDALVAGASKMDQEYGCHGRQLLVIPVRKASDV